MRRKRLLRSGCERVAADGWRCAWPYNRVTYGARWIFLCLRARGGGGGALVSEYAVWLVALPIVLAAFFLWFFRDPSREIPQGPGEIVSPGDGVVTEAEWIETVSGSRLRLSIFLNVFDVHVNRVAGGRNGEGVRVSQGRVHECDEAGVCAE